MNRAKKGESKGRGHKAIIGIAMAAIMLAFVMVAMAPTVSAKDITSNYLTTRNGYHVNPAFVLIEITEGDTDTIKIGQLIIFANAKGGDTVLITGIPDTNTEGEAFSASTFVTETEAGEPVDILYFDTTSMRRTGPYRVTYGALSQNLSVSRPTIPIELKGGPELVSTICAGSKLSVDCSGASDLSPYDCVDLIITDPRGRQVKTWTLDKTQKFDEINVAQLMEYGSTDPAKQIDTTDWILGTYTFSVVTEWENARGLDLLSETKTLQVLKGEVDIDVDKTGVVELEPVTVTMAGIYGHTIHVESTAGRAFVEFEEGHDDFAATYDRKYGNSGCCGFDVVMEGDSRMQFPVRFHDTGAYEIEATDLATYDEDTVVVKVSGKEVSLDMPDVVAIGENLTVKGTANAGDYIDIAIEDYIVKQSIPIAEDGTFEANLPTPETPGTGSPGAIKIEAFIRLAEEPAFSADVSDVEDDGSVKLFMQNDAGGGIDIAVSDANVGKNETIIITICALPGHNVSVTSADPLHTVFEYNRYDFTGTSNNIIRVPADTISIPADIADCSSQADAMNIHGVWKTMDGDGVRKFELHFTDVGTYKITATDYGTGYPTATRLDEESIEILVAEKNVTFDVPAIVVIGDKIQIRGTANAGDTIDIAIDDYTVYVSIPIEADGTFAVDLLTPETRGTGAPVIIRIDAFTRLAGEPPLSGDVSGVEDDGYAEVFLVGPWLTASLSTDTVDLADNFTISGTASGSDFVDIVTVAPRGGAGRGINPASVPDVPGITYDSSAVSDIDDSYLKELYVDEDADTGKYLVVVLSPGPNGVYDELNSLDLFGSAFEAGYGDIRNLGAKTQEQILAIIADATVDAAGSDDLLWVGTIVIKG